MNRQELARAARARLPDASLAAVTYLALEDCDNATLSPAELRRTLKQRAAAWGQIALDEQQHIWDVMDAILVEAGDDPLSTRRYMDGPVRG